MLSAAWHELKDNWVVLSAILGVFFLYKIREEEALKTRLKLISECYHSFALLNDAVQDWASPVQAGKDYNESFMKRLGEALPDAHRYFHQASILMRPETVREINKVFVLLGLIRAEYTNWLMFKEIADQYPKELVKAFDNARKHLPKQIQTAVCILLTDFQIAVNGPLRMIWWKLTQGYYPRFRGFLDHELLTCFEEDRKALLNSLK